MNDTFFSGTFTPCSIDIPGAAKSNPLKLFAVFPAIARNFNVKFDTFM